MLPAMNTCRRLPRSRLRDRIIARVRSAFMLLVYILFGKQRKLSTSRQPLAVRCKTGAAGVAEVLCGIGRNQAAIAAPTATSVIRNMTNIGHRAGLLTAIGPVVPTDPPAALQEGIQRDQAPMGAM